MLAWYWEQKLFGMSKQGTGMSNVFGKIFWFTDSSVFHTMGYNSDWATGMPAIDHHNVIVQVSYVCLLCVCMYSIRYTTTNPTPACGAQYWQRNIVAETLRIVRAALMATASHPTKSSSSACSPFSPLILCAYPLTHNGVSYILYTIWAFHMFCSGCTKDRHSSVCSEHNEKGDKSGTILYLFPCRHTNMKMCAAQIKMCVLWIYTHVCVCVCVCVCV